MHMEIESEQMTHRNNIVWIKGFIEMGLKFAIRIR